MRKSVVLGLGLTLAVAAFYALQALYHWEWTRALWMTTAFVAAEVALVGVLVLNRLRTLGRRLDELAEDGRRAGPPSRSPVLQRIEESRPSPPARFAWLEESVSRTNVFVTMLVGGGALVSGVLWVVDKVAGRSVVPGRERQLAEELEGLAFPAAGLVPAESPLVAGDLSAGEREDLNLLLTGRSEGSER